VQLARAIPNQDADLSREAQCAQCVPAAPGAPDWNIPGNVRHEK
jgi:hypothetical protein